MKNIKNFVATLVLFGVIIMGASNANAGILLGDYTGSDEIQTCSEESADGSTWSFVESSRGIIVFGFTGIIVFGIDGEPV
ncbi:MAG TPA: hypothetical protein VK892_12895, partial [Pyrinomonadaceae bacterium]|nr:hypothetical protein [Pyrinomonadaceae bacterium]